jgi:hypothetical protein
VNSDNSRRNAVLPTAAALCLFLNLQASHGCCDNTTGGHMAASLCRSCRRTLYSTGS